MDQQAVAFARSWATRYVRTRHPYGLDEGDVEIARSADDSVNFNVVKACAADAEGSEETTYEGCFATSFDVKNAENAVEIARWGATTMEHRKQLQG